MVEENPLNYDERILQELLSKDIRFLVVGGVAVNLHGYLRATADLDLMIALDEENVMKFVGLVRGWGWKPKIPVKLEDFANSSLRESWVRDKGMKAFAVYNPKRELEHIDLVIETPLDFESAYKRKTMVSLGSIKAPVVSIDDLIKMKKSAGRVRDVGDMNALIEIKEAKSEEEKS